MREYRSIVGALTLLQPDKRHEAAVMAFRQAFLDTGDDRIPGGAGLHHYESYHEWLKKLMRGKIHIVNRDYNWFRPRNS